MRISTTPRKVVTIILAIILIAIVPLHNVSAEVIRTQALVPSQAARARLQVESFLNRQDVQAKLISYGISPNEAQLRVSLISDSDAQSLAHQIDQMPAGGDALSTVVLSIVVVFFVLLFTDIFGFTKVFPFTKSIRH